MARTTFSEAMGLIDLAFEPLQALAEAAYMLIWLGDFSNAHQVVDALLIIAPQDTASHYLLAELLLAEGHYVKAEAAARQASRLAGSNGLPMAEAYNLRARAALGRGDMNAAVDAFNTSLSVDPMGSASIFARSMLSKIDASRRKLAARLV